ncbi:MAG TPA: AAA family ATPase [Phycisphaerae bacterium]|nr:AAA family ATPase [Phycisphaerae bacterium]
MRFIKEKLQALAAAGKIKSLRAVAGSAGVPESTFFSWLNGEHVLAPAHREKVEPAIRALGIRTTWAELECLVADDDATAIKRARQSHAGLPAFTEQDNFERRKMMMSLAVRQRYGLAHDPFSHEVGDLSEVFLGPAHRHAYDAMLDAAKYCGFAALIAEVGFGKTVLRKYVADRLKQTSGSPYVVCNVEQLTRERLTTSRILDELLTDITGVRPMSLDETARTRKLKMLLEEFHQQGKQVVVTIDEAHVLPHQTLRGLKRLYEIESGLVKHLSILLFGQLQLYRRLASPDIEEVSQRVSIVMCYGLRTVAGGKIVNGLPERKTIGKRSTVADYITQRLQRAGVKDTGKIIEPKALDAIAAITDVPLRIHSVCTAAFNLAYEIDHDVVKVSDVDALRPEAKKGEVE